MIYSTCFTALGYLKHQDITKEDIEIVKSLYSYQENNQITSLFNRISPNTNLINNQKSQNKQNNKNILSKENLLKLDLKKKELKSIQSIKAEEPKMTTCNICFEQYDEKDIFNPELECKHHIHGECFLKYIENELNSNHFPIRCPICLNQNRHEINYKIILDCLLLGNKDKLAVKLENKSLNYLAENNPDAVSYCPTAGCKYMCFYDKDEYHLNCPLCKKSYCLKCKTEWHRGLTCGEYQMHRINNENEIKFEEYVKGNNFKQCPNCKRWAEKISGCDHIVCTCGREFCYHCGQLYDINGYHECNYNDENYDEDSYNSYLEEEEEEIIPRNNNNNPFRNNQINNFGFNNIPPNGNIFGNNNNQGGFFMNNQNINEINFGFNQNNNKLIRNKQNNNEIQIGFNRNNNTILFGNNQANDQINFGSNQNNNQIIFGNVQNNDTNSQFGNNQSNNQNNGTSNLFGNNQNNNTNNNGNLFGNNTQNKINFI